MQAESATGPRPSAIDADALAGMIDPERAALVVVDAQADFIGPQGAMAAMGLDTAPMAAPLACVRRLLAAARTAGVQVVLLRTLTRAETDPPVLKHFHARNGWPPASLDVCRAGTPGAAFHGIEPAPGDLQVEKRLYSGFAGTTLDAQLRAAGLDTIVVAGFTTECCVDCTVRDAFHLGYHGFVVADACAAYAPRLHEAALDVLAASFALIVDTASVAAAWSGGRAPGTSVAVPQG